MALFGDTWGRISIGVEKTPKRTVPLVILLEFCVCGDVLEKCIFTCVVIHPDTVVFQAIADDKVVYVEDQVVAGDLVKYLLGDGYGGALVFHYYFGLAGFVVDY